MTSKSGGDRRSAIALRAALMSGLATVFIAGLSGPSAAYSLFGGPEASNPRVTQGVPGSKRKRANARRWQQSTDPRTAKNQAPEKPQGPLMLVISIKSQKVTLYANGEPIANSIISTGVPGHDTPQGVFSVIEKDRYHHSNIYSGAPMPYMHRITWSGVALHEGMVTGHPASHGCIRLPHAFAARLWDITQVGVRVVISPTDVQAVPISNQRLFAMKPKPAVAMLLPDPVPTAKIRLATNAEMTDTPTVPDATPDSASPAPAAEAAPAAAQDDPLAAGRALTDAIRAEQPKPVATQPAAEPVKEQATVTTTSSATAPADEEPTGTTPAPVKEQAVVAPPAAEPVKEQATVTPPPAAEPVKEQAKAAEQPAKEQAKEIPVEPVTGVALGKPGNLDKLKLGMTGKEYPSRPGAITVFISRSLGKLFVRKGFWPVFETKVTIAQPNEPFGTHVFTALEPKNDTELNWNVVSMSSEARVATARPLTRAERKLGAVAARETIHPADPAAVLSRISIPDEAVERISEMMTPGASLIISDLGIGNETNRGTDFIIQTR